MPPLDLESSSSSVAPSLARRDTMNSLSSGYAANANRSVSNVTSQPSPTAESPTSPAPAPALETKPVAAAAAASRNRVLAPPPTQYVSPPAVPESSKPSESKGRMLYAYYAQGDDEVTVQEGDNVVIADPDDGSGWMHVRSGAQDGLVPASYVETLPSAPPSTTTSHTRRDSIYSNSSASVSAGHPAVGGGKKIGPAVAPRRGAKKLQYVEAMYDYGARSEMEWDMVEGDRFVLINRDSGDGLADVERGGVTKSVPANYIQEV